MLMCMKWKSACLVAVFAMLVGVAAQEQGTDEKRLWEQAKMVDCSFTWEICGREEGTLMIFPAQNQERPRSIYTVGKDLWEGVYRAVEIRLNAVALPGADAFFMIPADSTAKCFRVMWVSDDTRTPAMAHAQGCCARTYELDDAGERVVKVYCFSPEGKWSRPQDKTEEMRFIKVNFRVEPGARP